MNNKHLRRPFPVPPGLLPSHANPPWSARRISLAQKIAACGVDGMPVNIKYTLKTNTNEPESKDLRRFIAQGYAQLSPKTQGARRNGRGGGKQIKTVQLTNKGVMLLES